MTFPNTSDAQNTSDLIQGLAHLFATLSKEGRSEEAKMVCKAQMRIVRDNNKRNK